jgi:dTDP-4-amino-4,6-dideoxygalactose transaminase
MPSETAVSGALPSAARTHQAPHLPFALPDIGPEEIEEVADSLRRGWLTTGPKTKRFEEDFARYLGSGVEAIAVNSGTAGLHLALEAVGVGPGDEIVTTPYTFTATAEVIRYLGAEPVFADICPDTLNIDPRRIEAAITKRTRAIIPVHLAGLACDMTSILEIARSHNVKVVEDAAHALPATWRGQPVGSLESDATMFSFYATKPLATGEGGMLVTRDRALAARAKVMRLHGIDRDVFERYTANRPAWYYEVVAPGFKYNMSDLAASVGIHQLRKIDQFQRRRAQMAARYDAAFANLPVRLPAVARAGDLHCWHLYIVRLEKSAPIGRDDFIRELAARGVGASVHFIPLHLHPYWAQRYKLSAEDFPNALEAYRSAVSLPIYTKMTDEDQDRVIEAVREILLAL